MTFAELPRHVNGDKEGGCGNDREPDACVCVHTYSCMETPINVYVYTGTLTNVYVYTVYTSIVYRQYTYSKYIDP